MKDDSPAIHELAAAVHGALVALHALGCLYNIRRRNWLDAAIHGAAVLYSADAVHGHVNSCRPVADEDVFPRRGPIDPGLGH